MFDTDYLSKEIEKHLTGKRLEHSLSVKDECEALADMFGVAGEDRLRLLSAAVLHDITKEIKGKAQPELLRALGVEVTPEQLASPKTLHAISGAAFALKEYPDQIDAECARLIRSHTTGRVGMTLCEKLLYLADYIEPLRTWDDCRKLRKDFYSGARKCSGTGQLMRHLDDIIIESYDMTISELISSGGVIASETVASRNDLIIARNSQNEL